MYYDFRSRPSRLKRCFRWLLVTLTSLGVTLGGIGLTLLVIAIAAFPAQLLWNHCVVGTWPTVPTLAYLNALGMLILAWGIRRLLK